MLTPPFHLQVLTDLDEVTKVAAESIIQLAQTSISDHGHFTIALAGGSTPKRLYAYLARSDISTQLPWDHLHVFWGDERHVPPAHPDSNFRMAHESLLQHVPIPPDHIHRIRGECPDAAEAAQDYEDTVLAHFQLQPPNIPRFDLILLGMGADGHTASLFPGTEALHETVRLVTSLWVEQLHTHRVTMTPPLLNNAAHILFLVTGEEKAQTLRAVLKGPQDPDRFPCQLIRPSNGEMTWLVDRAAASRLNP